MDNEDFWDEELGQIHDNAPPPRPAYADILLNQIFRPAPIRIGERHLQVEIRDKRKRDEYNAFEEHAREYDRRRARANEEARIEERRASARHWQQITLNRINRINKEEEAIEKEKESKLRQIRFMNNRRLRDGLKRIEINELKDYFNR